MEDLGQGSDLARLLCCGTRAEAEDALTGLGAALGGMYAATSGHEGRYAAIRERLGPGDAGVRHEEAADLRGAAQAVAAACQALDIAPGDAWRTDLEAVAAAMDEPGPFLTYTTGDPCLDNALLDADGRVRLHDLEFGAFRHALRDGVYGRMRFPTCWCVRAETPRRCAARPG